MPPPSTHIKLWWATLPGLLLFAIGAGFEITSAAIHSSMNFAGVVLILPSIIVGILGLSTPTRPMLKVNWGLTVPVLGVGIYLFVQYMRGMEQGAL